MPRARLLLIGLMLLAGCALPQPTIREINGVQFVDAAGLQCPFDKRTGGCVTFMPTVYRPSGDPEAQEHEYEHVLGMEHGPWTAYGVVFCAKVTAGGATHWRPGELMCRMHNGRIERGNP